jgi:PhnB protein
MAIQLNPYLSFKDKAKEAMEFYKSVFGGELTMQTFKEFNASTDPSEDNLVMHAMLRTPNDMMFMASDTPSRMEYKPGTNFNMSISGDEEELMRGYFEKLSEGGTVTMPMEKAAWGDIFGMCVDKFGVSWFVDVSPAGGQPSS